MRDEVLPYVPDAWVDHDRTKIGYEIPLTRHFYKYVPPRPLEEIDAEIKALEDEIQRQLSARSRGDRPRHDLLLKHVGAAQSSRPWT